MVPEVGFTIHMYLKLDTSGTAFTLEAYSDSGYDDVVVADIADDCK
jgi:hypothetical protein